MQVGDIIDVYDGSYSMSLTEGKLQHTNGTLLLRRRFRILDANGAYPIDDPKTASLTNSIMAVDVDDPSFVVFTQSRFCRIIVLAAPNTTMVITAPRRTKRIIVELA